MAIQYIFHIITKIYNMYQELPPNFDFIGTRMSRLLSLPWNAPVIQRGEKPGCRMGVVDEDVAFLVWPIIRDLRRVEEY